MVLGAPDLSFFTATSVDLSSSDSLTLSSFGLRPTVSVLLDSDLLSQLE